MKAPLPASILFCCDQNSVRSPMAEGIMKKLYGRDCYVQSAGVRSDLEIDGFAIAACSEIGVELSRHRVRSFDEMQDWGDDLSSFDLVVALSPASEARVLELSQYFHMNVEYWPIIDPTNAGESRETRLAAYRDARDMIIQALTDRWGSPAMAEQPL
ncbi:low molecular weight phosphatase family protein [Ketogulonicigenium vulgare]|uniref:Arsenate reductase, putative n=1 Tax=Ketogulonicigenium vulgare (strain WSH-001) TaxID=759362 RepID=F9YA37_KETVW|nr:low molecular weight phosphatase family protein [Ketogulonicigenium vulgare]ADO43150.1 arsenate reductase [Ketogulonicigenium vulgare Y25]AEM41448.1 Arsenate reductase, putative [Ketogulonicigenium vulgare WSH-001]ALJ81582.1 ArsC family transcriptional regulator [Ketogulonicigenium vulgare]ANW34264.1 ArsC family transcriptional regulator [Ketogulonicigenium vulgare]AOZ55187.1 arsenate reductase [Ketogulonicigenium vulgare]